MALHSKKSALVASTAASGHGHGYWLRAASARSNATKEYSGRRLATSERRLCTRTYLLSAPCFYTQAGRPRANGASAPAGRSRRHPRPQIQQEKPRQHMASWTMHPRSPTHADAATSPRQNNARALELLLSNAAAARSGTARPWPWTMLHAGRLVTGQDKWGPTLALLLHCYCTSHAWTRPSRNLWVLGYNTATCCQDAFPIAPHVTPTIHAEPSRSMHTYCTANRRTDDATCARQRPRFPQA